MYPRNTLPERQRIGLATINNDPQARSEARRDYAHVRICNEVVAALAATDLPLTTEQRAEIIELLGGE